MPKHAYNRNDYLDCFDKFAPRKRTMDEVIKEAVARKKGEAVPEQPPQVLYQTENLDLVRFHLNSRSLEGAYKALGDTYTDPLNTFDDAQDNARFGVMDRASGEPVAILWMMNDRNSGRGFEIPFASFSRTRKANPDEILDILRELDIPPGHNTDTASSFVQHYDIWHENGEWISKQPRELLVFTFKSTCFAVRPVIEDRIDVFVPIHPDRPLDGNGDENEAYGNREGYRTAAWSRFLDMGVTTRPGFSSWGSYGDPRVVKVTEDWLDHTLLDTSSRSSPEEGVTPKP